MKRKLQLLIIIAFYLPTYTYAQTTVTNSIFPEPGDTLTVITSQTTGNFDPAISSAVFLITITDISSVGIFLGLASLFII